ncbi:NAC domain-containing protein 86-like [Durio zibethinus]|uniref:NAC domain-containing protein 86-like n=1 Tax=Durio zibethinus TaxID=66656 RepID=A0A6P5ZYQ4_DURZI|nr:NAC domain-containing protein 86-like [Durio zibethinus]XP_022757653.1 NAC domain-containing protein 86-like [Durio zibethinus]XP_022757654.1 NAC domain-containing protein 86-like [Durio zibethinus]
MNIFLEIGFRFLPPDEQIIRIFLINKMIGDPDHTLHIREVDLNKQEPWDLPDLSIVRSTYHEWFFFYKLNKISERKNDRSTKAGYWKSTGKDRDISYRDKVIGTKKTLVFYTGHTPHGVKTDWVMHEFRAAADIIPPNADNSYVVGYLKNNAAENTENSIPNDGQSSTYLVASGSQNNAVGVTSMEVAPQLPSDNMDYEIALQIQMKDQGIFDYDLSSYNGLHDLPSSSAIASNGQNRMEEEGISLEDLLQSNDPVDDEQNEWQLQFDTIEEENEFMISLFHDQDENSYVEAGHHLHLDYRAPDHIGDGSDTDPVWTDEWCDQIVLTSDGAGHGQSEGFNQKRMENSFRHDEIHYMNSSVDSATVTAYEINCLESVREENSVNSKTCKSQYEPRSHKSVMQGKEKAVSRDKTRESGVRRPVVNLVRGKRSIVLSNKDPKMDRDRNAKSDMNSRSNVSAGSGRKNSFNFLEMSQLNCKSNPPLVNIRNILLGVILFVVVVREVMFLH